MFSLQPPRHISTLPNSEYLSLSISLLVCPHKRTSARRVNEYTAQVLGVGKAGRAALNALREQERLFPEVVNLAAVWTFLNSI